ncbi:hypothetical protein EVAR_75133_1 [Eumeta japonica]|uniref:Endonuclease/exonuclease/phosphatase domain-containing protein n=1 Tax=Eumeta variegata TaxID=151549 RepID=A0A4C1U0R7_EUMVA|nr:hypothetical protein EVAR_75133_1 [Eumeta japonica]
MMEALRAAAQFLCTAETRYRPRDRFSGHRGCRGIVHGGLEQPEFPYKIYRGEGGCGRSGLTSVSPRLPTSVPPTSTIFDDSTPTILAGDLNAKHTAWGSRVICRPVDNCCRTLSNMGMRSGPDTPSHIPTNPRFEQTCWMSCSAINSHYPIYVEVLYDMDTQHLPILITLGTTPHDSRRPPTHRTDWDAFRRRWGTPHRTDRRWDLPPFETRAPEETQLAKLWAYDAHVSA